MTKTFGKLAVAVAAATMTFAPAIAAPAKVARAAATAPHAQHFAGTSLILALIAAAGAVAGIVAIADKGSSSP